MAPRVHDCAAGAVCCRFSRRRRSADLARMWTYVLRHYEALRAIYGRRQDAGRR